MEAVIDTSLEETIALIRASQAGDREASETLFRRYQPRVLRIVALRLGAPVRDLVDCEDLAQETLMHAFVNLDRFDHRSEGSFRNWLASIVENRIRDRWRRLTALKRGDGKVRPFSAFGSSVLSESILAGKHATPSQEAVAHETEERLEAALLALDERSRRAIELRRLCGMSYAEVAVEMGLGTESSARAMVARALARLSPLL